MGVSGGAVGQPGKRQGPWEGNCWLPRVTLLSPRSAPLDPTRSPGATFLRGRCATLTAIDSYLDFLLRASLAVPEWAVPRSEKGRYL